MMTDSFCVLYFCDQNLHDETLFSIASLAKASQVPVDVVFIQANYDAPLADAYLSYIRERNCRIQVKTLGYVEEDCWKNSRIAEGERDFKSASFHKIDAIESVLESYDWVFYVDGDVLFFEDPRLKDLIGFEEVLGACYDISAKMGVWNDAFISRCKEFGVSKKYFNAGFLCINSRLWDTLNIRELYYEMTHRHTQSCPYHSGCRLVDQCIWNMVVDGRWHAFDTRYNVQASCMHSMSWRQAIMRHYTGFKPKFLPIRNRRCDRKENALIRDLNSECEMRWDFGMYDNGFFYALNSWRRRRYCNSVDRYMEQVGMLIAAEGKDLKI